MRPSESGGEWQPVRVGRMRPRRRRGIVPYGLFGAVFLAVILGAGSGAAVPVRGAGASPSERAAGANFAPPTSGTLETAVEALLALPAVQSLLSDHGGGNLTVSGASATSGSSASVAVTIHWVVWSDGVSTLHGSSWSNSVPSGEILGPFVFEGVTASAAPSTPQIVMTTTEVASDLVLLLLFLPSVGAVAGAVGWYVSTPDPSEEALGSRRSGRPPALR